VSFNEGCASAADAPVKSESVIPATPSFVTLLRVFRFAEFFTRDILRGSCLGKDYADHTANAGVLRCRFGHRSHGNVAIGG
jgi:hypothetical protein